MADVINGLVDRTRRAPWMRPSIQVFAPRDPSQRVSYLATLENLEVDPAEEAAKIIVNSRTGTIVIAAKSSSLAAITAGGLFGHDFRRIRKGVVKPNAFQVRPQVLNSTIVTPVMPTAGTVSSGWIPATRWMIMVQAINQVGVAPGDLMAILGGAATSWCHSG